MDTSYVAVGTVMYMITDSLTCHPQKRPSPERRAGAALGAVLLVPHKAPLVPRRSMRRSTSEPAVLTMTSAAGSTAGQPFRGAQPTARPSYTVSPAGQRHSHRKPLGGTRKPRRSGATSRHRAMVRVRMDLACYTLPLRSGAVVQAELSSALLCWWRLAAQPAARQAVHHGDHNQDDDHRSGPQNPSVLKEVHGHLLCRSRNRHVHDNR